MKDSEIYQLWYDGLMNRQSKVKWTLSVDLNLLVAPFGSHWGKTHSFRKLFSTWVYKKELRTYRGRIQSSIKNDIFYSFRPRFTREQAVYLLKNWKKKYGPVLLQPYYYSSSNPPKLWKDWYLEQPIFVLPTRKRSYEKMLKAAIYGFNNRVQNEAERTLIQTIHPEMFYLTDQFGLIPQKPLANRFRVLIPRQALNEQHYDKEKLKMLRGEGVIPRKGTKLSTILKNQLCGKNPDIHERFIGRDKEGLNVFEQFVQKADAPYFIGTWSEFRRRKPIYVFKKEHITLFEDLGFEVTYSPQKNLSELYKSVIH
jgi:hypothetical protein